MRGCTMVQIKRSIPQWNMTKYLLSTMQKVMTYSAMLQFNCIRIISYHPIPFRFAPFCPVIQSFFPAREARRNLPLKLTVAVGRLSALLLVFLVFSSVSLYSRNALIFEKRYVCGMVSCDSIFQNSRNLWFLVKNMLFIGANFVQLKLFSFSFLVLC